MGELEEKYEKALDIERNKATIIRLLNDLNMFMMELHTRLMENMFCWIQRKTKSRLLKWLENTKVKK